MPKKTVFVYKAWEDIRWSSITDSVLALQQDIYKAKIAGDIKRVRVLQNRLLYSEPAKLLAVRRVTQDNRGKVTAGVDGVKNLSPRERSVMAGSLYFPQKSAPLRRVWIPKPGKPELRPLGIPIMKDRVLQALFKLAMEPEWEAIFEANSYGFRPGRRVHDAVAAVRNHMQKKAKYVIDADITKCFDRIDHDALLDKIGMRGKFRTQLKYWLKAGILDAGKASPTDMGTPQGGVISPLLANIALHGMEDHLRLFLVKSGIKLYRSSGVKIKPSRMGETLSLVRYADDFIVLHDSKPVILACLAELKKFLGGMGLELSASKTRLTHTLKLQAADTLEEGFDGTVGFNFLGFTFRSFFSRFRQAYSTTGEPLGFYTLIVPSRKSINAYQAKLHDIVLNKGKVLNQVALIRTLNPVLRGWTCYFGLSDANTAHVLSKQDYLLYLKLRKWAKRVKGTSGRGRSFFSTQGTRAWTFMNVSPDAITILARHIDFSSPIGQYTKIEGTASPYDGNVVYWTKRMRNNPYVNKSVSFLLTRQKGLCAFCGALFTDEDVMEQDHIIPLSVGGAITSNNLQLLHGHCHDQKTAEDVATFNGGLAKKKTPRKR